MVQKYEYLKDFKYYSRLPWYKVENHKSFYHKTLKTISVFAIKSRESKFVNVTTQRTKQKINYNVVKTS